MNKTIAKLRALISALPVWGKVAVGFVLALAIIFGIFGVKYTLATEKLNSANTQIADIREALENPPPPDEKLLAQLETEKAMYADWQKTFSYNGYSAWRDYFHYSGQNDSDLLISIITEIASQAGVNLRSIGALNTGEEEVDALKFETKGFSLKVQAKSHMQIYEFLNLLYKGVPIFTVPTFRLSGFSETPSADLELRFYILQQPDSDATAS